MSLVRFRFNNQPQQVANRGAADAIDDRATDHAVFAELNQRFSFTLDVAASPQNAKCVSYFTRETDGLSQQWKGRIWCNPPYSSIEPWVTKAWEEYRSGNAELIVMLLPANRTEQGWWQRHIEPPRRHGDLSIEFLAGRMRFIKPGKDSIGPNERPPFGVCLAIWMTRIDRSNRINAEIERAEAERQSAKARGDWVTRQACDPLPCEPVVYMLLHDGEVIYVGATTTLRLRLSEHRKTKRFDAARYMRVDAALMNRIEAEWIVRLRPPLNVIDCRVLHFFGVEDVQRLFTYGDVRLQRVYRDRADVAHAMKTHGKLSALTRQAKGRVS